MAGKIPFLKSVLPRHRLKGVQTKRCYGFSQKNSIFRSRALRCTQDRKLESNALNSQMASISKADFRKSLLLPLVETYRSFNEFIEATTVVFASVGKSVVRNKADRMSLPAKRVQKSFERSSFRIRGRNKMFDLTTPLFFSYDALLIVMRSRNPSFTPNYCFGTGSHPPGCQG